MLINSVPLKPLKTVPDLQKFPLTILSAIAAVLFISMAILVMNHFLADSAAGGGLSNPEQLAKANILRISMWAMGGLFLALSGFVIVSDVIIYRSNRREVALAAAQLAERERFEEQLLQVQNMESIGRLAGGVAHDFNNLLTPIISYAQLCKMNLDAEDPLYSNLEEIEKAADRAADVTHKLLAFSRQQVIELQDIELNRLVVDLGKMLHRLIDENVEMSIITAPDVGLVKVEPGQIEQVMVNLVVNARDAMPEGGKLTVTTRAVWIDGQNQDYFSELTPGNYVELIVSDTGNGIDEEVQRHIFEPFFTTKDAGKGTGLGLATCYGIVKQSGGDLTVTSRPGEGATFKILLPQVNNPHPEPLTVKPEAVALPKGTETVLLAEDEPGVLEVASKLLSEQGYRVLRASNGVEALGVAWMHAPEKIDLLLTDVVMPQMNGKDLADQLEAIHPGTRVLYTSGYTDEVIGHHGVLEEGTRFLQKPFSQPTLAHKVRQVLDEQADSHAS